MNLKAILIMNFLTKISAIIFLAIIPLNTNALSPEKRLNEKDEKRARQLFLEIRCPICQGQVIENSDSQFSKSMRQLVRQKISQGKSNKAIKEELVKEFGTQILTDVNPKNNGLILWLLPILFGTLIIFIFLKK